jgi:hypothetical protein
MANRIRAVDVRQRLMDLTEPEIWVTVRPERVTPTTEIVGRLVGPRCRFATTVEVAYPLRPFARPTDVPSAATELAELPRRVVIPEASYWEPESPFLYEGAVELWENGKAVDRHELRVGLRTIQLVARGLRVNGKPLALRVRAVDALSEHEALALRDKGINAVLAPVSAATTPIWDTADRLGFFVIGRVPDSGNALATAKALRQHPSRLAWLVQSTGADAAQDLLRKLNGELPGDLLGVELRLAHRVVPSLAQFLLCPADLPQSHEPELPRLVFAEGETPLPLSGSLGWVRL